MNDAPLPRLIDAAETKASGELVCEAAGMEVHIYMQAGRIAWATDSAHPLAFRDHLKENARLDDESYKEVMAECRQSRAPLGETLVAWKLATPEQVRNALSHQIKLAITKLEQFPPSAKAVFLARPQYSQYSPDYTFELREIIPPSRTVPAAGVATGAARPNGSGGGAEERRSAAGAAAPAPNTPPVTRGPSSPPAGQPPRGSSRKLVVIAVVVLVAVAAVVATLGRPSRQGPQRPVAAPAEPASSPPSTAAAEAAPSTFRGVTATEVVFGMSGPFSGATKELGRAMRVGIETAFALTNEGGGVHGRKLRLVALDDGYDPSRTLKVMQDLVESRKVFGTVGNAGTPTAAVSLPYVMEKKVLFFGALTGAGLLRKSPPDRYVFNYRPSYAEETAAAVAYLMDVRRIPHSQIALFHQDDNFGLAGVAGVEGEVRKRKLDPARMVRTTYQRNSADVSAAVAVLKKAHARVKAVVTVATYQAAIQLIQQAKDAGLDLVFTHVSAVNSNALAEGLVAGGAGYTSGVVVTQIVPLPTSQATAALEYQAALEKYAAGEKPGFVSFEGFVVAKILVEGLRHAGANLDTESLVTALEGIRGLDLGIGTPISFGPTDHQGSHKVWGTMLQSDGSYKSIKLE